MKMIGNKFDIGDVVIDSNGNSKSIEFKVLDYYWYETTDSFKINSQYEYTLCEVDNPRVVFRMFEYQLKLASEVCPMEVHGNLMVGKTVKDVHFDGECLEITFEDGYTSKYEADGDELATIGYGDNL